MVSPQVLPSTSLLRAVTLCRPVTCRGRSHLASLSHLQVLVKTCAEPLSAVGSRGSVRPFLFVSGASKTLSATGHQVRRKPNCTNELTHGETSQPTLRTQSTRDSPRPYIQPVCNLRRKIQVIVAKEQKSTELSLELGEEQRQKVKSAGPAGHSSRTSHQEPPSQ